MEKENGKNNKQIISTIFKYLIYDKQNLKKIVLLFYSFFLLFTFIYYDNFLLLLLFFQNQLIILIKQMSNNIEDVEKDIIQLKSVLEKVERVENRIFIENHIKSLSLKLDTLKIQIPVKVETPVIQKVEIPQVSVNFITISKYSYDQEGKKVKIYFSLENIGKQCTQDQIKVIFGNNFLELKIFGYKNQNHIFVVRKLAGPIDPKESKFILKNNTLILSLTKSENKHWDGINYKEPLPSTGEKEKQPQGEKSDDPNASLMNLMKKMYDQGDDNMKRTIAQTWSKQRENPGKGGMDEGLPPFGEPSFRPFNKKS